ncbi:LysR family transcriptional regulator [Roseibium sp.]|uniref:LysR family transcriptional regulator n=1 Tax=Roseibium sp. TaxID=1936156 RepID=UPI00391CDCBA
MLNSNWLTTFTVLCETQSFTKTAQRLNMTQPGVSQHLKKLEEQIGQDLVVRSGRIFTLTPAGTAVLEFGKRWRTQEQDLLNNLNHDDPGTGTSTLACSGSFALLLYPRLLALMGNHSSLALHLHSMPQNKIIGGLLDNTIDLGIVSEKPTHTRLDVEHLGREELCLLLPADFGGMRPEFDALQELGFIGHPDGYGYADRLLSLNYPNDYSGIENLRLRGSVNQIGQIPIPMTSGVGYTVLPRSGIDAFSGRGKVAVADLEKPLFQDLWMCTVRNRPWPARQHPIAAAVRDTALQLEKAD